VQVLEQKLLDQQAAADVQLQELSWNYQQQLAATEADLAAREATLAAAHQQQLAAAQRAAVTEQQQLQQKVQQLEGALLQAGAEAEQEKQFQLGAMLQLRQQVEREGTAAVAEAKGVAEAAKAGGVEVEGEVQAGQHATASPLLEGRSMQQWEGEEVRKALHAWLAEVLELHAGWEKGLMEGFDRAMTAQEQRLQGLGERLTDAATQQQQVVAVALAMRSATADAREELAAATRRFEAVQQQQVLRERYWEERVKQQQAEAEVQLQEQARKVSGQVQEGARAVVLVHQLEKQLERVKARMGAEAAGRIRELEEQVGRLQGALAAAWQQLAVHSQGGGAWRGGKVGVGGLLKAAALGLEAGSSNITNGSNMLVTTSKSSIEAYNGKSSDGRGQERASPEVAMTQEPEQETRVAVKHQKGLQWTMKTGQQAPFDARSTASPSKDQELEGRSNGCSKSVAALDGKQAAAGNGRREIQANRQRGPAQGPSALQQKGPRLVEQQIGNEDTPGSLLERLLELESVAYQLLETSR
jgi:hypothetical protein